MSMQRLTLYTYKDYLEDTAEGEYFEIINGVPQLMSPMPDRMHQEILGNIFFEIKKHLKGKSCKVFVAPFDVRIPIHHDTDAELNVLQPDILVVCDENKLDNRGCKGAPDMIIEILSPSTAKRDKLIKSKIYERAGVKEYWIVNPKDQTIDVSILENGIFKHKEVYQKDDKLKVHVLTDLEICLCDIFEL